MLLPGSPFRQHADEIYGHYHLKPNVVYQISGTRTGLSSECESCLPAEQLASKLLCTDCIFAGMSLPISLLKTNSTSQNQRAVQTDGFLIETIILFLHFLLFCYLPMIL